MAVAIRAGGDDDEDDEDDNDDGGTLRRRRPLRRRHRRDHPGLLHRGERRVRPGHGVDRARLPGAAREHTRERHRRPSPVRRRRRRASVGADDAAVRAGLGASCGIGGRSPPRAIRRGRGADAARPHGGGVRPRPRRGRVVRDRLRLGGGGGRARLDTPPPRERGG